MGQWFQNKGILLLTEKSKTMISMLLAVLLAVPNYTVKKQMNPRQVQSKSTPNRTNVEAARPSCSSCGFVLYGLGSRR